MRHDILLIHRLILYFFLFFFVKRHQFIFEGLVNYTILYNVSVQPSKSDFDCLTVHSYHKLSTETFESDKRDLDKLNHRIEISTVHESH